MKRVFIGDDVLIAAGTPNVEFVTDAIALDSGLTATLDDDQAFSALSEAMGSPLSAGLWTRSVVLEPESTDPPVYEKCEARGTLYAWEALGVGYGITDGSPWLVFSLFYTDPSAAESDAEELVQRMRNYKAIHSDPFEGRAFGEICEPASPRFSLNASWSVLTVSCNLSDGLYASTWWSLLDRRDIGFLLP